MSAQLAQALQANIAACERIVEQYGAVQCGVNFAALLESNQKALAAFEAAPQQAQAPFTHAVATTTNGRPGITIYDLGPSLNPDSAITAKLIEMGWTPPSKQAQAPRWQLVPEKITEEQHVAACKVLLRAIGMDGLPQRMLDAIRAAAPQQGSNT